MNIALVFAGGTGQRMNSKSKPKQFLDMHGKPILIYTLEYFEKHKEIDAICIVCLAGWEEELKRQLFEKTQSEVKEDVNDILNANTTIHKPHPDQE